MVSGGTPRHSWVCTHTLILLCCLQGFGALRSHTEVQTSKVWPLQTTAEHSTTAKLIKLLALQRKLPEIHVLPRQWLQESSSHPTQELCDAGSAFQPPADLGSLQFSSLLPRPENAGHGLFWSGLITDKSSKSILGTPDPETDTRTIKEPKQMEVSLKSNKKLKDSQ